MKKYNRKSLLAKIHIAKKQLGLSDDIYRGVLAERYGVRSAKELKNFELIDLCRHFEKLGFEPKPPKKRPSAVPARTALVKKIVAMSYSLNVPIPEYANGIAKRMFGIDDFSWCTPDQLHKIVAALTYHQKRKEVNHAV
ncbi:Mu-like prophage protein gp16 [Desulfonauticus submarinus]|uniref:Mu-like prophage protein gp16 n=1 Tax=Desulfonauticus submarinus TaxID=206665 RepID=A0A1H0G9D4_9BACT|nr:regulatory protein GemA [Desulfonauticus submarinus]SDO03434.1 Mu-like prophage protein gp16 [Desulfonauticus submarinus]